jgi:hypothetical protein
LSDSNISKSRLDQVLEQIERPRMAAAIIENAVAEAGHTITVNPEPWS